MNKYSRITKQERYLIEKGICARKSKTVIAKTIGRPVKTVSEEIDRNGGYLWYYAEKAHYNRNQSNRKGHSKIDTTPGLAAYIREKLEIWSPEIIAKKWSAMNEITITHESIYTWIYGQENNLYLKLPRSKKKRGLRPQRSKSKIPNRVSIDERPKHINDRSELGHYEGDLVFQQGNQSKNICSLVERKSRKIILIKNQSKRSDEVIGGIKAVTRQGEHAIDTITFDNGSEFSKHSELGINTYFCDPGSPWQKGAIENVNGMIRRYIDYRIDIDQIDQQMLDVVADKINNRPRKILGFLTPNQVFENLYKEKLDAVTF
jgi:transposase, IS30 family